MKPQELQPGNLISSIPGGNDWDATFIEEVMPTGVKIEVLYRLRRTPTTLTVCKNPGHGGFYSFHKLLLELPLPKWRLCFR